MIRVFDAFISNTCYLICTPFWGLEEDRVKAGVGVSAAVKRGVAFLSATELIRSLSFNLKWKFGVRGETMWV